MERFISNSTASAEVAYLGFRDDQNAHHRWLFGLVLFPVAVAHLFSYYYLGLLTRDGILTRDECYALTFAYLGSVALLALLCGRRPLTSDRRLNGWLGNGWVLLALIGAAILTTLDARITDTSAYVVICLPLASHSAHRGADYIQFPSPGFSGR